MASFVSGWPFSRWANKPPLRILYPECKKITTANPEIFINPHEICYNAAAKSFLYALNAPGRVYSAANCSGLAQTQPAGAGCVSAAKR